MFPIVCYVTPRPVELLSRAQIHLRFVCRILIMPQIRIGRLYKVNEGCGLNSGKIVQAVAYNHDLWWSIPGTYRERAKNWHIFKMQNGSHTALPSNYVTWIKPEPKQEK